MDGKEMIVRPMSQEDLEDIELSVNSFIADIEEELDKFQFWDECPSRQGIL